MLVGTTSPELKQLAAEILQKEIYVKPTQDLQAIFWCNPETKVIEWCIGFDGFIILMEILSFPAFMNLYMISARKQMKLQLA